MYAIIEDSGSQLIVREGDVIEVDLRELPDTAKTVTFERVLFIGSEDKGNAKVGAPYLAGATVMADIVEREFKGEKLEGMNYRRRKGSRRKWGHRQRAMRVKVSAIKG